MSNVERMTILLPEPLAAQIRAAVEAGEYASNSEAVGDAVLLWSGRQGTPEQALGRLRKAWDDGKASGIQGPIDFVRLRREAQERLHAVAEIKRGG